MNVVPSYGRTVVRRSGSRTDIPGFPSDESVADLGTGLKLPSQFEHVREKIEQLLPPLQPAATYA